MCHPILRPKSPDPTAGCGKPHVRWCGRGDGRNPVTPTRSGLPEYFGTKGFVIMPNGFPNDSGTPLRYWVLCFMKFFDKRLLLMACIKLGSFVKFVFMPFRSGWPWLGLLALWVIAYPGLQEITFVYPEYSELQRSAGKITFSGGYQYRNGKPFFLITPKGRITFACRAVKIYRADCFSSEAQAELEGKSAEVWWFPQSRWFFGEHEEKVFQVEIGGGVILGFSDMNKRYRKQTSDWGGYLAAALFAAFFPSIIVFRIVQYRLKGNKI